MNFGYAAINDSGKCDILLNEDEEDIRFQLQLYEEVLNLGLLNILKKIY